jgi:site-specific DNA recombinase
MNAIAALYGRVSTPQQEQEATMDSQVASLEAFAQAHGYQLLPELYFLDQAVSGAQLARPALDRLRDLAGEGAFSVVLCLSPDRLARNYAHQWVLLDELHRVGVQVVFVNQPMVADDPQGQLLLGIQGLFAEYERAMITERLRRGKLYRIRHGQLVNPNPPYGYRYIPVSQPGGGRWDRHPVEAKVVEDIFRWYTTGQILTIAAIVDRLNQLGSGAPPRGRRWTFSTVQAILKQPAYTGRARYNRTRTCHEAVGRTKKSGRGRLRRPTHEVRPEAEWIEVTVPSLVNEAVWQRAQERLMSNQQFAPRNNKRHFYLLRSMLVCGTCGRTLVGRTASGRVSYYCTNQGKNRSPDVPPHSCSIAGQIVEPLVWEAISTLLHNPALLADAWHSQVATDEEAPGEADRLQARQRALERQWTRLLDAFQDNLLDKAELELRKARLDQEQQALAQRLQQLTQQARREQAKAQMLDDFATFCQQIEATIIDLTPDVKQEVIRLLIDHIVVDRDAITIKHIIPTDDDCRLLPGRRCTHLHTPDGWAIARILENTRPVRSFVEKSLPQRAQWVHQRLTLQSGVQEALWPTAVAQRGTSAGNRKGKHRWVKIGLHFTLSQRCRIASRSRSSSAGAAISLRSWWHHLDRAQDVRYVVWGIGDAGQEQGTLEQNDGSLLQRAWRLIKHAVKAPPERRMAHRCPGTQILDCLAFVQCVRDHFVRLAGRLISDIQGHRDLSRRYALRAVVDTFVALKGHGDPGGLGRRRCLCATARCDNHGDHQAYDYDPAHPRC